MDLGIYPLVDDILPTDTTISLRPGQARSRRLPQVPVPNRSDSFMVIPVAAWTGASGRTSSLYCLVERLAGASSTTRLDPPR